LRQLQCAPEIGQKTGLGFIAQAVGIAHTDRKLERKLAQLL
jgi:hypothetical protein